MTTETEPKTREKEVKPIPEEEPVADTKAEEEKTPEPEVTSEEDAKGEPEVTTELTSPIGQILEKMNHKTCSYPNGVVLGVRTEGIKGTRGVHLDTVFVIDWDSKMFTGSLAGIQSIILEVIGQDIETTLRDVGLADNYTTSSKLTLKGTLEVEKLRPRKNQGGSLIHQTKTVYVLYREARPSVDLEWLTDAARVIHWDQFHLCRDSDRRSHRATMESRVKQEKWDILQKGITMGWLSVLLLIFGLSGAVGLIMALVRGTTWLIPVIAIIAGTITSIVTAHVSRTTIDRFNEELEEEATKVSRVGDGGRFSDCIAENRQNLDMIGDIRFYISPLMVNMGRAIEIGDVHGAVEEVRLIFDELVRLSPELEEIGEGDDGLTKFLRLFSSLDARIDEVELSIAYVSMSNHAVVPLELAEVNTYSTTLLNAVHHIGGLRPDARERIGEMMDKSSYKGAKVELDTAIEDGKEDEEQYIQEEHERNKAREDAKRRGTAEDDDSGLLDSMTTSGIPEEESEAEPIEEEQDGPEGRTDSEVPPQDDTEEEHEDTLDIEEPVSTEHIPETEEEVPVEEEHPEAEEGPEPEEEESIPEPEVTTQEEPESPEEEPPEVVVETTESMAEPEIAQGTLEDDNEQLKETANDVVTRCKSTPKDTAEVGMPIIGGSKKKRGRRSKIAT